MTSTLLQYRISCLFTIINTGIMNPLKKLGLLNCLCNLLFFSLAALILENNRNHWNSYPVINGGKNNDFKQ